MLFYFMHELILNFLYVDELNYKNGSSCFCIFLNFPFHSSPYFLITRLAGIHPPSATESWSSSDCSTPQPQEGSSC